ncbi:hypothetical protein [Providencia rettgeri]|uniref:hypothetical protein n=1 Tax=Providencia rettgeri TaxID=587 RepID=UPI00155EDB66|nr:hypothetical protein [Providencia rettgeri]QKG45313.1 hypothetical protein HRD55_12240 [Providencia rettgeri]QNN31549.1 hypothetical protein H9X60_12240 [Providencia rettgeri]
MFELIDNLVKQAAKKFGHNLSVYQPRLGKNSFNEKNLTYNLAFQFESTINEKNQNPIAFMEAPFKKAFNSRTNLHIDSILINESSLVLVEAKRLYHQDKMLEIESDWERMSSPLLINPIREKLPNKDIYKLVIAESWSSKITKWWGYDDTSLCWNRNVLFKHVGVHPVTKIDGCDINWLYAIEKLAKS